MAMKVMRHRLIDGMRQVFKVTGDTIWLMRELRAHGINDRAELRIPQINFQFGTLLGGP